MPLSAAEVLAGGLAVKNAASAGSIWGNSVAISKPPVAGKASPAPTPSKSRPAQVDANPLDSDPTACAASALLGLQKQEPTRMSHKQVEQHRRLKAKQYFDELRCLVPTGRDPKNDRNRVLQLAIEHLRNLNSGRVPSGDARDSDSDLMFSMDAEEVPQSKPESDADKRLSHNEVEQKRRQQARQHYEELRALLPNAGKYDKNTVLFYTIQTIRQKQGVSEQDLAKMVRELPVSEDGESDQAAGASNLAQLACTKTPLSESPTDVVSFTTAMALMQQGHTAKPSRKRTSNMAAMQEEGIEVKQEQDQKTEHGGALADATSGDLERKKSRRLSGDGAVLDTAEDEEDASAQVKQASDDRAFEAEMDGLDALSLLSHCAVQLQASQPTTPQMGPVVREGSWGEVSMMSALPQPGSSSGKDSLVAAAALAASASKTASPSQS